MAETETVGRVKVVVFPDTDGFRRKVEKAIDKAVAGLDKAVEVKPDFDNKHFNKQVRETIDVLKRLDRMRVNPKISEMRKDKYTEELSKRLDGAAESADRLNDNLDDVARNRDTSDWDRFSRKIDSIANDADRRLGRVGEAMDKSLDDSFAKTDKKLKDLADKARNTFENIDFSPTVKIDLSRKETRKRIEEIKKELADLDRTIKIGVTGGLDEDSFRELRRRRDEIQREMRDLHMKADLDSTQAMKRLRELKKAHADVERELRIGVHAEMDEESLKKAEHDYNALQRELDDLDVAIVPDVLYGARKYAQSTLAWLARPRRVRFIPVVDQKALRAVATALAALSGGRMLNKVLKDLWDGVKNLDKSIPKISAVTLAVTSLTSALLAATSNSLSLGGSIATIVPAALALPGIFGGMAIGLTITALAFSDMNKVIPDAVQQWKNLKGTMSDNFWEKAAGPIQRLTDVLMPQIVTGFTHASTAVGAFFGKFANSFVERADGFLVPMFKDLSDSIHIASKYAGDFANIIMTLGEHGAGRLPQLAGWFGDISRKFSNFLTKTSESGQLDEWIDRGIFSMQEFGRVISGASRILYHLSVAAEKAGGSTLTSLADTLHRIGDTVSKPAFQEGMINTFKAAHDAMAAISDNAGPALENFLVKLSDQLTTILPSAGRSLGKLLGGIFDALSQDSVMDSLTGVFKSLEKAIDGITPALPSLGRGFAGLLDVVGSLVEMAGPLLGTALEYIGQIIEKIAPNISAVIDNLGPALTGVVKAAGPGLVKLFEGISDALPGISASIGKVVEAITPLIPKILELAVELLPLWEKGMEVISEILVGVAEALPPVIEHISGMVEKLTAFGNWFNNAPAVGAWFDGLLESIRGTFMVAGVLIETFIGVVKGIGTHIKATFVGAKDWLMGPGKDIIQGLIDGVSEKFSFLWTAFKTGMDLVVTKFKNLLGIKSPSTVFKGFGRNIVQGLINGISEKIAAAKQKITDLKNAIGKVFSNAATYLRSKGDQLISGLRNGISGKVSAAVERVRSLRTSISNVFSNAGSYLVSAGSRLISGLRSGISNMASSAVQAIRNVRSNISGVFSGASSILWNAGYNIMIGLWNGINSMVGAIRSKLQSITSMIPDWKGPAKRDATLLTNAGELIMQSLIDGFQSKFGAVKETLGDLSDDIGGMQFATPDVQVGMSNTNMARSSYRASQSNTAPAAPTGGGGTNVNAKIILPNTDPNAAAFAVAHRLEGLARA